MANAFMVEPPAKSASTDVEDVKGTLEQRYPGRVVTHTKIGIWDWYEEHDPDNGRSNLSSAIGKRWSELVECTPYLVRLMRDVLKIPGCTLHSGIYALAHLSQGLVPALSLW